MKLFINDKRIKFIELDKIVSFYDYDKMIQPGVHLTEDHLIGDVLIYGHDESSIDSLLSLIETHELNDLKRVTIATKRRKDLIKHIKSQFEEVVAGGGIVRKNDRVLMIFRNGKWDLPKGKQDPGEAIDTCALREVEEECAIKASIKDKLTTTYHTYLNKNKRILKKCVWYNMDCLDDVELKPQLEEGITEATWMEKMESLWAVRNSYASIRYVLKRYYKSYGR